MVALTNNKDVLLVSLKRVPMRLNPTESSGVMSCEAQLSITYKGKAGRSWKPFALRNVSSMTRIAAICRNTFQCLTVFEPYLASCSSGLSDRQEQDTRIFILRQSSNDLPLHDCRSSSHPLTVAILVLRWVNLTFTGQFDIQIVLVLAAATITTSQPPKQTHN